MIYLGLALETCHPTVIHAGQETSWQGVGESYWCLYHIAERGPGPPPMAVGHTHTLCILSVTRGHITWWIK